MVLQECFDSCYQLTLTLPSPPLTLPSLPLSFSSFCYSANSHLALSVTFDPKKRHNVTLR